jgi:hypothetical protein
MGESMKVSYLVLILAAVVVLGWAIHHYSQSVITDSSGAPSSTSMISAPAVSAG